MIPFWPEVGISFPKLIDYTIQLGSKGDNPFTKITKEDVERCMEALRERDAMLVIMEANDVAG